MLVLSNEEIARLLTIEQCMAALEPMYRDVAEERVLFSPRVDNIAPNAHPEGYYAFKHMGGTWPREKVQALRINSDVVTHPVVAGAARRVKQPLAPGGRWVGLVLLFSTETGALLAMFPDGVMQRLRVGATSGLGLRHLAREDARRLALIGSGWQAGTQLSAALAVRKFREVRVWSPRRESREAFVAEARRLHEVDLRAADSAEACVEGADVIAAATSSMVRVIEPRWLKPGVHLSCIKTQEVDAEVLNRCDRVVLSNRRQAKHYDNVMKDTPNVKSESARGWWNDGRVRLERFPDLADVLTERAPGRESDREITCFVNNVGTGLQFAAAGAYVLARARAARVGTELPDDWFTEDVHP
ncbi:MAG TPA: ornithine cyclodeaminase family protein [Burkholderiales bacterium]|nr:ornithine cyclodeaminase family protein [Burkholderiales bacterium]